jgi:hypothetical protein
VYLNIVTIDANITNISRAAEMLLWSVTGLM